MTDCDVNFSDDTTKILIENYRNRAEGFSNLSKKHTSIATRLSWARLIISLPIAIILYKIITQEATSGLIAATVVLSIAFIILVRFHQHHKNIAIHNQKLALVNTQSIYRLSRDWHKLECGKHPTIVEDSYTYDELNLVEHGSVLHWLNDIKSERGRELLLRRLTTPENMATILSRQHAVKELTPLVDHRQKLATLLNDDVSYKNDDKTLSWFESSRHAPTLSKPLAIVLSLISVSSLFLTIFSLLDPLFFIILMLVNGLLSFKYLPAIHQELDKLRDSEASLKRCSEVIHFTEGVKFKSEPLIEIKKSFQKNGKYAIREISLALRIIRNAEIRHTGIIYLTLQCLTLWNFHIYTALLSWQSNNCHQIRSWFDAITEYEVLCALSNINHDHPQWCFPTIDKKSNSLYAESMGHPLLKPTNQVYNSVSIGKHGKPLLFITGSNMSGKSTLLRSIGVNILLARTGAPVCAKLFTLPNIVLASCFSSHDSLTEGTSLYMAQLKSLKHAVDKMEKAKHDGFSALFLFDEILSGTNSYDRHAATIYLIHQLVGKIGAIGVIATHDVDLANSKELKPYSDPYYFTESINHSSHEIIMDFDYKLRAGIAKSTNALQLLKIVGLGEIESSPKA